MTQRFINCTHKESLILLKEDTLIPSRENEHVYYISEFDVEELYMVFEEFGNEWNIFIHNELKILIEYATLKYGGEVVIYFPYSNKNSKHISIYEYYCAPTDYIIKYKAFVYLLNSLFNMKIQPGYINTSVNYLENIIYTIKPKASYVEKNLEHIIKYLNKYFFNYLDVKIAELFNKNISCEELVEALQHIQSIGNKLV